MKNLIALIITLSIVSCYPKQEKNSIVLSHYTIEFKEEFIGNGGFLIICKNGIIGFEESQSLPAFYYIENNSALSRFINHGQGPNEVLLPFNIQYLSEDTIGVYDIMNMSYYNVPILRNGDFANIRKCINFDTRFYRVIKTAYQQYIALSGGNELFSLLDSDGQLVNTFFEYPYKDKNEKNIDNSIRALAYQGTIATNLSATKYVYAPFNGDIIHFYNIEKNNITLINKIENVFPYYDINKDGAITNAKTTRGYVSITTTENFVYALFCGKPIKELIKNDKSMEGDILIIFDWNGNKIKEFKLDVLCKHIGVSHDDKTLWAIANTPEVSLVNFELDNSNNKNESTAQKFENNNISSDTIELPNEPINNNSESEEKKSHSNIPKIELNNIHVLKVDSIFLVREGIQKITSIETTSNDITLNTKYENNHTIIYFLVKKQQQGHFSDTVSITFEDNNTIKTILFGKAIE